MKRYLVTALLFLPVLITGCIGEDWSLCGEDDNCMLRYRYHDENGTDAFAEKIKEVDIIFFDRHGLFVQQYYSSESELAEFQGIIVSLEPGDYYAVAWGNLGRQANNSISTNLNECRVEIEDENGGAPVYYAPYVQPITRAGDRPESEMSVYRITVPQTGVVERDLDFTRAHRSINVYIKGYEDPQSGLDPNLRVEISHLAYAYNFMLRVEPERRSHISVTELMDTPEGRIPGTKVNTPYQEIEEEINIDVTTMDGRQVCPPINLKEFLTDQGVSLDPVTLHDISIIIVIEEGNITVQLAAWSDNEVAPVW